MIDNPVGKEEPAYRFRWKLPQVLLVLFALAIVLTVFKYVQTNVIAPKTEIRWRDFSVVDFEVAQRQDRPIVLWVYDPSRTDETEYMQTVLRDPRIQKSVFVLNALAMKFARTIPASESDSPDDRAHQFIHDLLGDQQAGCLYLESNREVLTLSFTFDARDFQADDIVKILDQFERQ